MPWWFMIAPSIFYYFIQLQHVGINFIWIEVVIRIGRIYAKHRQWALVDPILLVVDYSETSYLVNLKDLRVFALSSSNIITTVAYT